MGLEAKKGINLQSIQEITGLSNDVIEKIIKNTEFKFET